MLGVQHPGGSGGFERVGRDRIPAAEHELVEAGEVDDVADERFLPVGQRQPGHLAQRADGRREALAGREDAGDEGRGHGAHAWQEDAERAGGRSDGACSHAADDK